MNFDYAKYEYQLYDYAKPKLVQMQNYVMWIQIASMFM